MQKMLRWFTLTDSSLKCFIHIRMCYNKSKNLSANRINVRIQDISICVHVCMWVHACIRVRVRVCVRARAKRLWLEAQF